MTSALQLLSHRRMDALTATAAAGIRSRVEALDLLANNLANANSTGYKADRELYRRYAADAAYDSTTGNQDPTQQPDIDSRWTDFSQGVLTPTGEPLDVALEGAGFFAVSGAQGQPLYTRDGHFRLNLVEAPAGNPERRARLETQDGLPVLGNDGKPVLLDPRRPVEFARDGTLRQDGLAVNRLLVVDPAQTQQLQKRSGNYFSFDSPLAAAPRSLNATVQQGRLEAANVTPAESAVRLIHVMRQFESLQKALQIGGEMNRRSVEEVAKFT
ncbi:MAG: flagellar hook basal-body protein [Bryobacteraceae bacterium]|nr:flagellar hook basal-body protein [Bryobacteraceae bacterium]